MSVYASAVLTGIRSMLAGSPTRRAVSANSGWLLFDKLVRALLGLVVGAWIARHLGPDNFGALAYVAAYVALFLPFANLGADAIVVRGISQAPDLAPALLGTSLALRLGAGLLCWLVAVALSFALSDGRHDTVLLTAVMGGVLAFQACDVVDLWFQSQAQSRLTVVAKLSSYLLSSGIKVAMVLAEAPLIGFAAVTLIEALASAVALYIAYGRLRTPVAWSCASSVARGLLHEAWPLMLSGFAVMVYMRIDQIMIKQLLDARALGVYAVALPISQFWQLIPLTLASSLAPFVARQKLNDEKAYRRSIVLLFRGFFYFGVLAAAATFLFSGWIVRHLFGSAYADAARLLDFHVLSNVFCFLGIAHGLWLVNERRFAVRLWGTVLAGATTIVLNLLLLPVIGVAGACVAAIIAQAVAAFLINAVLDKQSFGLQVEAITFRRVHA